MTLLHSLVARTPYPGRAALVVAHPDDETIAAGGSLHLLPSLLLVHVTDGAPRGLVDAARAGFGTPEAYAAARRRELAAALAVAGAAPALVELGVPDQDASLCMGAVIAQLHALFGAHGVDAVLTHAYEGGHPDHDATAFCVAQAAGAREVVEFPAYHAAADGQLAVGCFLPPPPPGEGRGEGAARPPGAGQNQAVPPGGTTGAAPGKSGRAAPSPRPSPAGARERGQTVALTPAEQAQKQRMLACFHTQRDFLQRFPTTHEPFRPAPAHDFSRPPHPGPLNYERWGWPLDGARWREYACKAQPCAA